MLSRRSQPSPSPELQCVLTFACLKMWSFGIWHFVWSVEAGGLLTWIRFTGYGTHAVWCKLVQGAEGHPAERISQRDVC